MTARDVPSGTSNGPVSVEFSGERYVTLRQDDPENREQDLIVIGVEQVPALAATMLAVAHNQAPIPPDTPADFHYAVPAGVELHPVELGGHRLRGRQIALLQQVDGTDEDGPTIATIAIDAAKLNKLISHLHALKGLLR
jgi:hypothetical protein